MSTTLVTPKVAIAATSQTTSGVAPATVVGTVAQSTTWAPTVGTAVGNVNLLYSAAQTVTNGTPLVLDLTSLTDPNGNAVVFAHVQAIVVTNNSIVAGQDLTIGGGTNPLSTDLHTAQANGGAAAIIAPNPGFAVVGSSTNNLKVVVAAGTTVPFSISIYGRST